MVTPIQRLQARFSIYEGEQTYDADCTDVVCGDNTVNAAAGETCDDGNGNNNDACPELVKGGSCLIAMR